MRYDDFAIEIRELPGGGWEAQATSSTQRRGSAPFHLPVSPEHLEGVLVALERQVWRSGLGGAPARELGAQDETEEKSRDIPTPEGFGEGLYEALFQGDLARVFHASLGQVEGQHAAGGDGASDRGLQVRFVFDRSDADFTEVGIIPWELLFRADRREFLARHAWTPVVRSIEVHRAVRTLRVSGTPRVLLAEAAPSDLSSLETSREALQIKERLEGLGRVEVVHEPHAQLRSLSSQLKWGGFHVLHLMGHGSFEEADGPAILYLETPDGHTQRVDAWTFAENVKRSPTIRLVVLNACDTGSLPRQRGRDPFAATAAALAMAGVPAVVAMQFPISDPAALAFSSALYESLAHGELLATALVDGRLAIYNEDPSVPRRTLEWATPVLYLQGGDEAMMETEPQEARPSEAAPTASKAAETGADLKDSVPPLRLGIRSLVGLGQDLEEEADRVLDLTRYFEGRWIHHEALWHGAVLPELRAFLAEGATTGRPLILDLAAHQSLAFAAGSFLEAKSGVEISVVQRGQSGTYSWLARPGEVTDEPLWRPLESVARAEADHDVAAAVSVTWEILSDVELYLAREGLPVGRIVHALVAPETSNTAVRDGAHALRLAQGLGRELRRRTPEERLGTLHLFAAAPNALLVFLGQISPALGAVQLYEYDFDTKAPGAYRPSFRLSAERVCLPA